MKVMESHEKVMEIDGYSSVGILFLDYMYDRFLHTFDSYIFQDVSPQKFYS